MLRQLQWNSSWLRLFGLCVFVESEAPSIASISGTSSDQSESVFGASPGLTYIDAFASGMSCSVQVSPPPPATVATISQTPASINVSSGDTNKVINVAVAPASVASSASFSSSLVSNKLSASTASISFKAPSSFTGNDPWTIVVSGTNSPSGIFSAKACDQGLCVSQTTTVNIPPQVLVQLLNGEAGGQTGTGDMSQVEIGMSARNRIGDTPYFPGSTNYQTTITATQYYGLGTAAGQVTTGVLPALNNAVTVFQDTGDLTGGSECYWSPTTAQWQIVQQALASKTTVMPANTGKPACYNVGSSVGPQIVYSSLVANNNRGGNYANAPAFVFLRPRSITGSNVPPAVIKVN